MTFADTPIGDIPKIVAALRESFMTHHTQSLENRKIHLRALEKCLTENQDEIVAAIYKDLHRPKDFEVALSIKACKNFIDNLETMTQSQKGSSVNPTDDCYVRYSPLGTVLIIGTWNFPTSLLLIPLAGAIAAGNTVIIKPSEVAPACAEVVTRLISQHMDPSIVRVVHGGVEETKALLEERFDHILYTGNTTVARSIMTAAAKHLTPVTLELGGKCPAIITDNLSSEELKTAAGRIAYFKTMNAGQVCISVDYILCPKSRQEELIQYLVGTWKAVFGEDLRVSENYPRIINKRQFDRLERLLNSVKKKDSQNKIVYGGRLDANDLFIEPTIVTGVSLEDELMESEIFGPILPIITCESLDEAIKIVNSQESPLNMNLFTNRKEDTERFLRETRSGAVNVNEVSAHYSNHSLPFGGVGNSGIGNYHGRFSIETFSHKRAIIVRGQSHL